MKFTNEQIAKARQVKSVEELLALAKENGVELAEEEAKRFFADFHREGEIADDELDNVAGGGCGDPTMYGTDGDWAPVCDGNFKLAANANSSVEKCHNCYYYQGEFHGYGVCMREVW